MSKPLKLTEAQFLSLIVYYNKRVKLSDRMNWDSATMNLITLLCRSQPQPPTERYYDTAPCITTGTNEQLGLPPNVWQKRQLAYDFLSSLWQYIRILLASYNILKQLSLRYYKQLQLVCNNKQTLAYNIQWMILILTHTHTHTHTQDVYMFPGSLFNYTVKLAY